MRSIPLLAAATVILFGAWACGDGGGGVGPNSDPVANFTVASCAPTVACTFTDASTDPDGNNTITGRKWNFGDGTNEVTDPALTQNHTFATAGTYQVTLTVTDNGGKTNSKTIPVTVATGNVPPTASFDIPTCNAGTACPFHSTSTDDGTIVSWEWNFGDPTSSTNTASGADVQHTFNVTATTPFTVTLTVTDDAGATAVATQTVTVSVQPPTSGLCTTVGSAVNCTLDITAKSTVKFTLTSRDCELNGNRLTITAPVAQTVFTNMCSRSGIEEYTVQDAAGAPLVFQPGSKIVTRFTQGAADPGDPAVGAPGIKTLGTYPSWTLKIDDGGNPLGSGEPDFTDAIVNVDATSAP